MPPNYARHARLAMHTMPLLPNVARLSVRRITSIIILLAKSAIPAQNILDIIRLDILVKHALEILYITSPPISARNAPKASCIARLESNAR